jgi:dihydrofolate reductase
MIIAAIVVTDLQLAIGKNNQLLCHLPADLKFFKATTMGYPVLMGRKTYESIGRVLKGRRNLVVTHRTDFRIEGAEIYHSIDTALQSCKEEKVFIIGGAEIFRQSLEQTNEIYRTLIKHTFEADTFFPPFDNEFKLVSSECFEADEKNAYPYCFEKWLRKS